MGLLATITASLMPIIKHSHFKTGCYITLALAACTLIYFFITTRKKAKEAIEKKEITHVSHPWSTAIFILFFISLSFGVMANILEWNEPGKITVLDNGEVITKTKPYISIGTKPKAVYRQKQDYMPSNKQEKQDKPVKIVFSDHGEAQANYGFTMALPREKEKIKKIHEQYGSQEKLLYAGAKPYISEAIKIGAKLLKSEESSKEKEKKLLELVKDQVEWGHYIIEEGKIKKDSQGHVIRKSNPFVEFKVKFHNIELRNIRYEELVTNLEKHRNEILNEIKAIGTIDITKIPSVMEIEKEIHGQIEKSKHLSKEQKTKIIQSLKMAKRMLLKLEKRKKECKKEPEG
jgi:hypothetical protein